jgi:hypothetical protein
VKETQKFYGITGKSGNADIVSSEIPITTLLKISTLKPLQDVGGLNVGKQKGLQRPVDDRRVKEIATVFNRQVERGYPLENGSVVLASENGDTRVSPVNKKAGLIEVEVLKPLAAIDRQHTVQAFRLALENPEEFEHLKNYVTDSTNTVTVRVIRCGHQEALRRCIAMNTGQKKWTPLETMFSTITDAKINEAAGIRSHEVVRGHLVGFQACYFMSKDPQHPLYGRIPVELEKQTTARFSPMSLVNAVRNLAPLHNELESLYEDYASWDYETQARKIVELSLPYWQTVREMLPEAFEEWYNYNTLRKGGPILMELFTGLVRVWGEYHDSKAKNQLKDLCSVSLDEYARDTIPALLRGTDGGSPWKQITFWKMQGGVFIFKEKREGLAEVVDYIWACLKPSRLNNEHWRSFVRVYSNVQKMNYNWLSTRPVGPMTLKRRKKSS